MSICFVKRYNRSSWLLDKLNWMAVVCLSEFADAVGFPALLATIGFAIRPAQKEISLSHEEINDTLNP